MRKKSRFLQPHKESCGVQRGKKLTENKEGFVSLGGISKILLFCIKKPLSVTDRGFFNIYFFFLS